MQLTGVFEVLEEIPEIGAMVGDRLVIGEREPWPVCLVRNLGTADARWAFTTRCALLFTDPPSLAPEYRSFRGHWLSSTRPAHLRLMR